ncbi:MAG: SOS response-associated peptidase [Mycobacterium sp.]
MCGRFAVTTDPARLAGQIHAVDETGGALAIPNYNVAPTTTIAAVVESDGDGSATRRIRPMRWGLLPSWVKADSGGRPLAKSLLINARAETLTTSPAFRSAARHRRCLVPMDGYYEWMRPTDAGPGVRKTPFYLFAEHGRPLLMAGLWSAWKPPESPESPEPAESARPMLTAAIVTTDAVGELARVHDRMPLVIAERDWDRWLDPDSPAPADLLGAPPDVGGIAIREVSTLVNRVANNGPELIAPADRGNQPVGLF